MFFCILMLVTWRHPFWVQVPPHESLRDQSSFWESGDSATSLVNSRWLLLCSCQQNSLPCLLLQTAQIPGCPGWPTPAPPPARAITGHMPGISWLLLKWRRGSSCRLAGPGENSQMKLPGTDRRRHGSAQNLFVGIECCRLRPLDLPSGLTQAF